MKFWYFLLLFDIYSLLSIQIIALKQAYISHLILPIIYSPSPCHVLVTYFSLINKESYFHANLLNCL